ncbi:polysaccharide deacetylase family protein [Wenjunlia tyrosinilytica]|uniref:polysaccharide deacetylase family protein n=1 Tax=Wenjunlia tyrosinilytica TaxID=1544741 RepID=UPI001664C9B7|nr:polysaccharide deacetylase family protein [Wenjunlia tyrosinilytica]
MNRRIIGSLTLTLVLTLGQGALSAGPSSAAHAPIARAHVAHAPIAHAPITHASATLAPAYAYDESRCGNSSGRVLLTFDDWAYSDPRRATRIGEYLEDRGIRAAFFLIEEFAKEYPDIVPTLRRQGHWVANHTYSHQLLTALTYEQAEQEIENGVHSDLLRPPYGSYGEREKSIADSLGYRMCLWTIDTLDWEEAGDGFRSVDSIRDRVRDAPSSAKRNGVVLGHLDYNYPDAVPGIIDDLEEDGYRLCRNDGAVGEKVPSPLDCAD